MTKAVILAAGSASRMQANLERYIDDARELDAVRKGEKMAARFARFPFLDYQILNLVHAGITRINIVVRPDDTFFTDHYRGRGGAAFPESQVSFSYQEEPDGTARALLAAERFVGRDRTVVLNGDNNYPARLVRMIVAAPCGLSSMAAFDVRGFGDSLRRKLKSFAVVRTKKGKLEEIVEKPEEPELFACSDLLYGERNGRVRVDRAVLASMNLWCFEGGIIAACRDVPRHIPRKAGKPGEFELPDAVRLYMDRGNHILVYYAREDILDLTTAEDIEIVGREVERSFASAVEELERRYALV